METPSAEELVDVSDDRQDVVYQSGLRIAEAISLESQTQGRKRRPDSEEPKEDNAKVAAPAATAQTTTTSQTSSESPEPDQSIGSAIARHRRSAVQSDLNYVGSEEECLVLPPSDDDLTKLFRYPSALHVRATEWRPGVFMSGSHETGVQRLR